MAPYQIVAFASPAAGPRPVCAGTLYVAERSPREAAVCREQTSSAGRANSGSLRCRRFVDDLRRSRSDSASDPCTKSSSDSDDAKPFGVLERGVPEIQTGTATQISKARMALACIGHPASAG